MKLHNVAWGGMGAILGLMAILLSPHLRPAAAQPDPDPSPSASPAPPVEPSTSPTPQPSPSASPAPFSSDPVDGEARARLLTEEEAGEGFQVTYDETFVGEFGLRTLENLSTGEVIEVIVGPKSDLTPADVLPAFLNGLGTNASVTRALQQDPTPAGFGADAFQASGMIAIGDRPAAISVVFWTQGSLLGFTVVILPESDTAAEAVLRIATRQRDKLTGFVGEP